MTPIDEIDEDVRLAVYRAFADAGRPPAPARVAKSLGNPFQPQTYGVWSRSW